MKVLDQFLCFLLLVSILQISTAQFPTFQQYCSDFHKNHPQSQIQMRKNIYEGRIQELLEIDNYSPGVNNLTDWTTQEISKLSPMTQLPPHNNQIIVQPQNSDITRVGFPQSMDWRVNKVVTSVKDQGTCGSCWAFGAAAYIQSKLIIQKQYPNTVDLSQQYLLSCTNGSNCDGGWPHVALQLVVDNGIPYQKSYPYTGIQSSYPGICLTKNTVKDVSTKMRYLTNVTDDKMIQILQYGPLIVYLSATKWETYGSGIFTCPSNAVFNHVTLLVGYTNDSWIVKNQWGKSWGEAGYMRITRSRSASYKNCFMGVGIAYLDPTYTALLYETKLFQTISLILSLLMLILF